MPLPTKGLHSGRGIFASKAQPPMRPMKKLGEEKQRNNRKQRGVRGKKETAFLS